MPNKTSKKKWVAPELPSIPKELIDQFVSGPMTAEAVNAAFNPAQGRGAYVAMESFEGEIAGRAGTFNFIHSAATTGKDRSDEFFSIVGGSGTGALASIRGTGGMRIDADGTHSIWFDIEGLAPAGN